MAKATSPTPDHTDDAPTEAKICGLIMPISGMPGYEPGHWSEVRNILERAISAAGYTPRPVWEGVDSDIIHDRIMANLYQNTLAVCDVSGLNPNVMLELGIRLSFGRATIIVTDDFSTLPFDTRMIEHLGYPRDLHLFKTEAFIEELKQRIVSVANAVAENKYRPFIKNFSHVEAGKIPAETRSIDEVLLERVERLAAEVRALRRSPGSGKSALSGVYPSIRSFNDLPRVEEGSSTPARDFIIRVPLGKELAAGTAIAEGTASTYKMTGPGIIKVSFAPWTTLDQVTAAFTRMSEAGIDAMVLGNKD